MRKYSQWLFVLLCVAAMGCEDVIDVEVQDAGSFIVVDAWLDNESRTQTISLSRTQSYFDASLFDQLEGAIVEVTDDQGTIRSFIEINPGIYSWTPGPSDSLGQVGTTLDLRISWSGNELSASSTIGRVPMIDSIGQEFEEESFLGPEGVRTQFFARDPLGLGDTYWIKTYKNGAYLDKPGELNIAYDAGFDPGAQVDGLIFIPPIRDLTNPLPEEDMEDIPPWKTGDVIKVEIHSISNDAFFFLETVRDQLTNGDNGIFSIPLSNAVGNISEVNTGLPILGVFNVAAVSRTSDVID